MTPCPDDGVAESAVGKKSLAQIRHENQDYPQQVQLSPFEGRRENIYRGFLPFLIADIPLVSGGFPRPDRAQSQPILLQRSKVLS